MKKKFLKSFYLLIFFITLILSLYFRLKPIYFQNIPYTYDQGRDFLKAQEIVLYKNPTFIGPTTGIMGIYHGAWWYYFLSLAFFVFNGLPQGFAYAICFFYFLTGLFFYFFIKKELGKDVGLFFLILYGFSPYLIFISTFVINSGFTIPFILIMFYSLYRLIKDKKTKYLFLIFLSAGLIFEAQVSFGLFLIPSLILTLILINERKLIFNFKSIIYSFSGLIVAFLPRVLFEIKNGFLQTKTLWNYFFHPKYYNPKDFTDLLFERLNLFKDFYFKIFNFQILGIIIFIFTLIVFFYYFNKLKKYHQRYIQINIFLIFLIFLFSLFYKDNFWPNYLEGFSLFYLPIIVFAFYLAINFGNFLLKFIFFAFFFIIFLINLNKFYLEINNKKIIPEGMAKQEKIIQSLYQENKNKEFCLKIYTPPVIPYTYQYLIEYYSRTKNYPKPKKEFINDRCWYIIEDDQYKFRVKKWREENIPLNSKKIKEKKFFKDIIIELWSL